MQIHLVANSYSLQAGGAEKLVRQLHRGLLRENCTSHLVGLERQADPREDSAESMGLGSAYHPLAFFRLWRYVRRRVRPGDVVHGHLFPTVLYLSLLRMIGVLRAPTIMTEHSTSNRRRNTRFGRVIDSVTYRGFDRICAISAGTRDALLQWQPQLQRKCSVVYNGIELRNSAPLSRNRRATPIILSLGNLREAKNYTTMLRALALLKEQSFEYQVAGEGPLLDELRDLAQALGLGERVRFLGRVDDIDALLAKADILLMASAWEGFGLAAVEAMHASLPLVISDIPGLAEVDEGEPPCSIKVDPTSENSIAEALERLLASPDLRAALGTSGFKQSGRFGLEAMVQSYLHEYRACHKPE